MLLAAQSRACKDNCAHNQMLFSFADNSKPAQDKPRRRQTLKKHNKQQTPATAAPPVKTDETSNWQLDSLKDLCAELHKIAAKHVPKTAFQDFNYLVQSARILQDMRAQLDIPEKLQPHLAEYDPSVVTHTPQYRLLRNRSLAALATIADLSTKAPAKGAPEYQKGMRDGFEYASDVAIFFLEDLEAAFPFRR